MLDFAEVRRAVTDALAGTTVGQELEQQNAERLAAERREIAKGLATIEREVAAGVPGARKRLDEADAKLEQARAALKAVELERKAAYDALGTLNFRVQHARTNAEKRLRETADTRITEFNDEMEQLWNDARRGIVRHTQDVRRNMFTDVPEATVQTNFFSVEARMAAIRVAQRKARDLQFEVNVDVAAALDELRSSIPELWSEVITVRGGARVLA
jgi:hypothetical protein